MAPTELPARGGGEKAVACGWDGSSDCGFGCVKWICNDNRQWQLVASSGDGNRQWQSAIAIGNDNWQRQTAVSDGSSMWHGH